VGRQRSVEVLDAQGLPLIAMMTAIGVSAYAEAGAGLL
jgi:hypothetical protein